VIGVETEESEGARGEHVDVLKGDVLIDGKTIAGEVGVVRSEDQRIGHIADADIAIDDLMNEAAAARVGFDAETIIGAIDRKVVHEEMIDATVGSAADGHAMAGVEVIVKDGHV
jgi:hypothetical protein